MTANLSPATPLSFPLRSFASPPAFQKFSLKEDVTKNVLRYLSLEDLNNIPKLSQEWYNQSRKNGCCQVVILIHRIVALRDDAYNFWRKNPCYPREQLFSLTAEQIHAIRPTRAENEFSDNAIPRSIYLQKEKQAMDLFYQTMQHAAEHFPLKIRDHHRFDPKCRLLPAAYVLVSEAIKKFKVKAPAISAPQNHNCREMARKVGQFLWNHKWEIGAYVLAGKYLGPLYVGLFSVPHALIHLKR